MQGWVIPLPTSPSKHKEVLAKEKAAEVKWLIK
jgi:hypothetical protein